MAKWKELKVFLAVAETGSFTQAARRLYLTQPAVSWQIRALEQELGTQLLERKGKRLTLTQAGEVFLSYARKLVELYEESVAAVEQVKGFRRGRLVIGASTIPGEYLLPLFLGRFHHLYPGIELHLKIGDTADICRQVLADAVQLGLVGAVVEEERLLLTPFLQDELVLVVPPEHRLARAAVAEARELAGERFILREEGSGTRQVMEVMLGRQGLPADGISRNGLVLGSTRAVLTAVQAGLGVSIVSRWAAAESVLLGRVKAVSLAGEGWRRPLFLATRRGREAGPLTGLFLSYLQDRAVQAEVLASLGNGN